MDLNPNVKETYYDGYDLEEPIQRQHHDECNEDFRIFNPAITIILNEHKFNDFSNRLYRCLIMRLVNLFYYRSINKRDSTKIFAFTPVVIKNNKNHEDGFNYLYDLYYYLCKPDEDKKVKFFNYINYDIIFNDGIKKYILRNRSPPWNILQIPVYTRIRFNCETINGEEFYKIIKNDINYIIYDYEYRFKNKRYTVYKFINYYQLENSINIDNEYNILTNYISELKFKKPKKDDTDHTRQVLYKYDNTIDIRYIESIINKFITSLEQKIPSIIKTVDIKKLRIFMILYNIKNDELFDIKLNTELNTKLKNDFDEIKKINDVIKELNDIILYSNPNNLLILKISDKRKYEKFKQISKKSFIDSSSIKLQNLLSSLDCYKNIYKFDDKNFITYKNLIDELNNETYTEYLILKTVTYDQLTLYDTIIRIKKRSIFRAKYLKYKMKYIELKGGYPLTESQKQKVIDYNIQDIISNDDDISDEILDEIIINKMFNEDHVPSRGVDASTNKSAEFVHPEAEHSAISTRSTTTHGVGDTFYIYTTGMGYVEDDDLVLLNLWIKTVSESITSCIPGNFTKIIIEHYDATRNEKREHIEHNINLRLRSTLVKFDERIISHTFILSDFPYKTSTIKRPHIVIDMAHIFGYYPTEENKYDAFWSGYYDHELSPVKSTKSLEPLNIKSIYFGFNDNLGFANKKLIDVKEDGTVRTFIDCLIDVGLFYRESDSPELQLDNLMKDITKKIYTVLRSHGKKVDDAFMVILQKYNLLNKILEKLFNGETQERIRNIETYDFYREFITYCEKP